MRHSGCGEVGEAPYVERPEVSRSQRPDQKLSRVDLRSVYQHHRGNVCELEQGGGSHLLKGVQDDHVGLEGVQSLAERTPGGPVVDSAHELPEPAFGHPREGVIVKSTVARSDIAGERSHDMAARAQDVAELTNVGFGSPSRVAEAHDVEHSHPGRVYGWPGSAYPVEPGRAPARRYACTRLAAAVSQRYPSRTACAPFVTCRGVRNPTAMASASAVAVGSHTQPVTPSMTSSLA